MNCLKAELLTNRYLENRLNAAEMAFYKAHLSECGSCRSSLELARALFKEQKAQQSIKTPDGFTDNVMAAVFKFKAEEAHSKDRNSWSVAYRRLGFSLVLTAGIVLFAFLLPVLGGYPKVNSPTSGISNASGYIDVLSGLDNGVKGIFKTINKSVIDFKGGTNNEM